MDSKRKLRRSLGDGATSQLEDGPKPKRNYGVAKLFSYAIVSMSHLRICVLGITTTSQFKVELREDTFLGNKNDDAHECVERILDIVSLFNIPGVSHEVVMLHVFPITLTGAAKRWVDRLPPGTINTWDMLKHAFIQSIIHHLK
ncbi:hypothetical protein Tco_1199370 [Tanacetum coccineum]